jgi:hypothetical protein
MTRKFSRIILPKRFYGKVFYKKTLIAIKAVATILKLPKHNVIGDYDGVIGDYDGNQAILPTFSSFPCTASTKEDRATPA